MNVAKIQMSRAEAQAKLDAYVGDKHADAKETYQNCALGYEALAAGRTLIHLEAAIREGGFHASGYPKLAIARADRNEVRFRWRAHQSVATFDTRADPGRRGNPGSLLRTIDMRREPNVSVARGDGSSYYRDLDGWAQVPLLPADERPDTGQLRDWFILWEVERWYARSNQVEPDRDPMLLEHIVGGLYAVLAEWELTDLERAVLAGALRAEE